MLTLARGGHVADCAAAQARQRTAAASVAAEAAMVLVLEVLALMALPPVLRVPSSPSSSAGWLVLPVAAAPGTDPLVRAWWGRGGQPDECTKNGHS